MHPSRVVLVAAALLLLSLSCNMPRLRRPAAADERRLVLGEPAVALTSTIGAGGGVLRVELPGSPIDGWAIEVPSGAYPSETAFRISSMPIKSHTFGDDFQPVTPLVRIDNGGAVAQGFLTIEVPVEVPQGYFPLAFTYDPETGALEGLPVMPEDGSVRIPMRAFSYITVAMVRENLLEGTIATDFNPQLDMWPFPNEGSAAAPAGYCAGASLTSLYYFDRPARGPLMQAYDPFDNPHAATPSLPEDDRLGIRLSSAAQGMIRIDPSNVDPNVDWWIRTQWDDARVTYLTLAGIMLATEQPQLVHLQNPSTAHAVVAYGSQDGRRILIADPNYPGEARQLTYDPAAGRFDSYQTGTMAGSPPIEFDRAFFLRKRDVIPWGGLAGLMQAFEAGTVGSDLFPTYTIWASSADPDDTSAPEPLVDGFQTSEKKLKLKFEPQGFEGRMVLYREDGRAFDLVESGGSTILELGDEQTVTGFLIEKTGGSKPLWVDFRWMRIGRNVCVASPEAYEVAYTWNREGEQRWSGSGGSGCRWMYTVRNTGGEPLIALLLTRYDNGTMQGDRWERFNLAPGAEDAFQVGKTDYVSGADTYDLVDRMLVVRDVPECQALLSDDQKPMWLSMASPATDFTCE